MDKNIAAFLRDDAYSVRVVFQTNNGGVQANFGYVTNIKGLEVGDFVVVPYKPQNAAERFSIAQIVEVCADLAIEPNSEIQYKWVIQKLDLTSYDALMQANSELQDTLNKAYRSNMKRNFAQNVLLGLDLEAQDAIKTLLGK